MYWGQQEINTIIWLVVIVAVTVALVAFGLGYWAGRV